MELAVHGINVASRNSKTIQNSSKLTSDDHTKSTPDVKAEPSSAAATTAASSSRTPPAPPIVARKDANRVTVDSSLAAFQRLSAPPARRKVAPRNVTASAIAARLSAAAPPPLPSWADGGSAHGLGHPPQGAQQPQQQTGRLGVQGDGRGLGGVEEEVKGLQLAMDAAGSASTPQEWLATHSTLSLASRSLERTLAALLRLHAGRAPGHGQGLGAEAADAELRRAFDSSMEEVAAERAQLSTALASLQERVRRVTGAGSRAERPNRSDKDVASSADDYHVAMREFREAARKAYMKLNSEEAALSSELAHVHEVWMAVATGEESGDHVSAHGEDGDMPTELQADVTPTRVDVNTSLASLRSSPLTVPAAAEPAASLGPHATPAQIVKALKQRMSALEREIEHAGGSTGGWLDDDHRTFISQLTMFLSARGRHHALTFSTEAAGRANEHSAAAQRALAAAALLPSSSLPSAHSAPLLSAAESTMFLDRACTYMPGWGRLQLAAHLTWYMWWRSAQEERLACVAAWKRARHAERGEHLSSKGDEAAAVNTSQTGSAHSTAAGQGGKTDLATRVAVAEWKAQREAEAQHRAALEAATRAAEEEARRLATAARLAASKARVDAWKADKEAVQATRAAVKMREEALRAAERHAEAEGAAARRQAVAEGIAAAAARRKAAEEAARAKAEAHARRFGPDDPSVASRARQESAARGEWDWWEGSLPPDPDRPTVAQVARAQTVADREQATARVAHASAHAKPVASVIPTARGKGFAFGVSAGALPSRATPTWRKGL